MAFSIRTFFGKDKNSDSEGDTTVAALTRPSQTSGEFTSPFSTAVTHAPGRNQNAAMNFASPFSVSAAPPSSALTVADVLPLLPRDVAKNPMLPGEHSLQLPEDVLERARQGSQNGVPLFEIYRVCPAMFQTPISPLDPRQIPLPRRGAAPAAEPKNQEPASPFSMVMGPPSASPFAQNPPLQNSVAKQTDMTSTLTSSPFMVVSPATAPLQMAPPSSVLLSSRMVRCSGDVQTSMVRLRGSTSQS